MNSNYIKSYKQQELWAPALLTFLLTACFHPGNLSAQAVGRFVSTHSDPWIPNFGHLANIPGPIYNTTQDGDWSNPDTWGGTNPTSSGTAIVSHSITFSTDTEVFDLVILSGGQLSFSTTEDTRLTVGTIQVHKDATLKIGTAAQPVDADTRAEIIFKDRPFNPNLDPAQYGNGLIVFGNLEG